MIYNKFYCLSYAMLSTNVCGDKTSHVCTSIFLPHIVFSLGYYILVFLVGSRMGVCLETGYKNGLVSKSTVVYPHFCIPSRDFDIC